MKASTILLISNKNKQKEIAPWMLDKAIQAKMEAEAMMAQMYNNRMLSTSTGTFYGTITSGY